MISWDVFSSRRRHTRYWRDWSSDVCSSDLDVGQHVDGPGSVFFQDGSVVNGVFFGGEGVEIAAHALQAIEHMPCPSAGSALESSVFAEVGQPLLAGCLVTCAGVDLVAAVDDG